MPDQPARLVAIVPVRTLEGAKSRLGEVLDPEERLELVVRLLERTVRALVDTPAIDETVVVSPDREVRRIATDLGARSLAQRGSGLNGALEEARDDALAGGATALFVVPADLPAISADAVAELLRVMTTDDRPLVAIVPDRHVRGTNALLLRPPGVIGFAFGGDSRIAHAGLASAAGVRFVELDGPLALDLDTPEDLLHIEAEAPTVVPR